MLPVPLTEAEAKFIINAIARMPHDKYLAHQELADNIVSRLNVWMMPENEEED